MKGMCVNSYISAFIRNVVLLVASSVLHYIALINLQCSRHFHFIYLIWKQLIKNPVGACINYSWGAQSLSMRQPLLLIHYFHDFSYHLWGLYRLWQNIPCWLVCITYAPPHNNTASSASVLSICLREKNGKNENVILLNSQSTSHSFQTLLTILVHSVSNNNRNYPYVSCAQCTHVKHM